MFLLDIVGFNTSICSDMTIFKDENTWGGYYLSI